MADDSEFSKDYYYPRTIPVSFNPTPHLVVITKSETGLFCLQLF